MLPAARLRDAFEHLRARRFVEAREVLEGLVRDELGDAMVFETLGDVREKLGDADGAVDAWRVAVDAWLARHEVARAIGVLELLLILRPDDVEALAEHERLTTGAR
jgi:predicted Zn-dependent protease